MVVLALARAHLGATLSSPDGLAWDSDHHKSHREVTLTGTMSTAIASWAIPPYLGLAMLWVIYIFPWPCEVEALLSPFNEWGSERLTDFPRVTQLISRRAGILPSVSALKLKHTMLPATEAKSSRNTGGNRSYWLCESGEKSWGGREMSAPWGQWRIGQGGGTCVLWVPGKQVHRRGTNFSSV